MENITCYKNNIKLDYTFTFLRNLNFTHGIWMIYLASKGFSLGQLGIFESVFHITSLLMETPTGAFADILGRKTSRIIGVISSLIYILLILLSSNFGLICLAFVFLALSYNFESGSGEALVYDSLKKIDKEETYIKVSGNKEVFFQLAQAIGIIIGGYIALNSFSMTFKLFCIFLIFSLISLFLMKEPIMGKKKKEKSWIKNIINQYKNSFNITHTNKQLLLLLIFPNAILTLVTISFFYLQNYWNIQGYSTSIIGIFLASHAIAGAFGGYFAHYLDKKYKKRGILLFAPILIVLCIFGLSLNIISFISMIILGALDSIFYIVISAYINQLISSEQRATILSFSSFFFSLFMIIGFPTFGYIGDHLGLTSAFRVLGFVGVIYVVVYYFILEHFITNE
ncbi:MFS transporter [Mycoplasmatota bacterium]|nr:MFS transporter [Mycoplasmatota bacterium]